MARGHDGSRRSAVVLWAVLAAALADCSAGTTASREPSSSNSSGCTARVTPSCSGYIYSNPSPGTVEVTAPKGSGGNNREFFWSEDDRNGADLAVCATFANGQGGDQQGIVLRLQRLPGGGVRGITVTRNVWLNLFNIFNFHVWNTKADPSDPFTRFGSTVVPTLPLRPAVYPLSMCARTVDGADMVQFVVWTRGQRKPAWGSTGQAGAAKIPGDAPSTGLGGWFAGHLVPGTSMTYSHLRVDGSIPRGLP